MNATSHTDHTAENVYDATHEAAGNFRRRAGRTGGTASDQMNAFLSDVDDLLRRVADVGDGDVAKIRGKVANALGDIRRNSGEAADSLRERAREAADSADHYVHDRPWTAIGLAAAAGVILGVGVTAATAARR